MNQLVPQQQPPSAATNLPVIQHETAAMAVAAQAKALVEARYTIAMRFPRDFDQVREALLKECKRPSFAAVAKYNKPIGDGIVGPSIRFAEAAIRCMKNITVETITVYDDPDKRIVRVTVTDLEANVPYSQDVTIQKTVERNSKKDGDEVIGQRKNSRGRDVYILRATDDDILNKQNALISKAVRTLGLRLVPGDLIEDAMWQVGQTQSKADAADPDSAKLRLFDSFGEIGIQVAQIKDYLGHDAHTLTPKELSDLRGLFAAIRDGEASWREAMDARQAKQDKPKAPEMPQAKSEKAKAAAPEAKQDPPGEPAPQQQDPVEPEPEQQPTDNSSEYTWPEQDGEPGVYLDDGKRRVLKVRAAAAAKTEDDLVQRYNRIDDANFSAIIDKLRLDAAALGEQTR